MSTARSVIDGAIADIRPPDTRARDAARDRQARLTKPAGALGRLEELHIWSAGVFGSAAPELQRKLLVVAASDHGVSVEGVSAYPQAVTAQMVRNILAGGAAVNVLAAHTGATVHVVDSGVLTDIHHPMMHVVKRSHGSANMTMEPALLRADAEALVAAGVTFARSECAGAMCVLGLGDMGIANTTATAAITAVMAAVAPRITVGRGTGIGDDAFERKVEAVERALALHQPSAVDPMGVLTKVGGCEIAFLTGVALGAASSRAVVALDGYPTTAAALIANALAPGVRDYMLASHLSAEPGHRIALEQLGLRPLLDLDMRLGEGTGAALAIGLLDAALRIPCEMATFESAGVSRSAIEVRPEA